MVAAEFQAEFVDGKIAVPPSLRDRLPSRVHVIVFAAGAEEDSSRWPEENRRRWELLAKKAEQTLTPAESEELAALQRAADECLAQLGPRPIEHLERWYAEMTQGK